MVTQFLNMIEDSFGRFSLNFSFKQTLSRFPKLNKSKRYSRGSKYHCMAWNISSKFKKKRFSFSARLFEKYLRFEFLKQPPFSKPHFQQLHFSSNIRCVFSWIPYESRHTVPHLGKLYPLLAKELLRHGRERATFKVPYQRPNRIQTRL